MASCSPLTPLERGGSSMKDGFVFLSSYNDDVIYTEEQEANNANVSVSLSTV